MASFPAGQTANIAAFTPWLLITKAQRSGKSNFNWLLEIVFNPLDLPARSGPSSMLAKSSA
jgi:hypothetical protein